MYILKHFTLSNLAWYLLLFQIWREMYYTIIIYLIQGYYVCLQKNVYILLDLLSYLGSSRNMANPYPLT